jgi:hypothetical protein
MEAGSGIRVAESLKGAQAGLYHDASSSVHVHSLRDLSQLVVRPAGEGDVRDEVGRGRRATLDTVRGLGHYLRGEVEKRALQDVGDLVDDALPSIHCTQRAIR